MVIIVVGLGSMGNRRLRLLRAQHPEIGLTGVDMDARRRTLVEQNYGIPTYPSISQAVEKEKPAAAVISTSPLSHASLIRECLAGGLHVFTELNLIRDGYEENMALAKKNGRVLFLSSTFLYRKETQYIMERVQNCSGILNYRYHVGQYLPDWHPWESYTDYFIHDKQTNACRELFAIELPWLEAAFGPIEGIQVMGGKCTQLNLLYRDCYMALLRHRNGHMGNLCVDVVSRKPVRKFELYGEDIYLTWDGMPDTLRDWNAESKSERVVQLYQNAEHQQGYASFVIENAYADELEAFLMEINQKKKPLYGFAEDLATLDIIDRIERTEE